MWSFWRILWSFETVLWSFSFELSMSQEPTNVVLTTHRDTEESKPHHQTRANINPRIGVSTVEIRRLSVPKWIQNGTEDSVVLDCEYVYNENDIRLVVKWFFNDNLEPVYQWIPELNKIHISGVLRGRLDLNFAVNTADAYSRFRALRISKPSTELSGKYTCLVTSLAGQDSREQVMTVFVPANEFDLAYTEVSYDTVNVSCIAEGLFPQPILKLQMHSTNSGSTHYVSDVKTFVNLRSNGAYDVTLYRTFSIREITKNGATDFECVLELPGTNYIKSKRIAYLPGVQRQRIDKQRGSSACLPIPCARWILLWSFGVFIQLGNFAFQ